MKASPQRSGAPGAAARGVAEASEAPNDLVLDEKPTNLTEVVYSTILEAIVNQVLRPDERLTEADVARRLNVSKTPVREAFVRLREIGLIVPRGARGSQVIGVSLAALRHAFELREALEPFSAGLAAERADESAAREILNAAEQSLDHARSGALSEFQQWDRRFHRAIGDAAANPRMSKATDDAGVLVRTLRRRDALDTKDSVKCGEAHVVIATAIADGERTSAEEQMEEHIRHVKEIIIGGSVGDEGAIKVETQN